MEAEFNAGIYCIINTINNKKYVGRSIDIKNRWKKHKSDLRRGYHNNPILQRAFEKYGENAFDFRVLVYTEPDDAIVLEQYILDNYFDLFEYNIARDAIAPMRGREQTDEAKQKISKFQTGHTLSEESRKKDSEAHSGENNPFFGKHHSEETREKMSQAHAGTHHSQETCKKIGKANSGKNSPNFGKHFSEEHKRKISQAQKLRWASRKESN